MSYKAAFWLALIFAALMAAANIYHMHMLRKSTDLTDRLTSDLERCYHEWHKEEMRKAQ